MRDTVRAISSAVAGSIVGAGAGKAIKSVMKKPAKKRYKRKQARPRAKKAVTKSVRKVQKEVKTLQKKVRDMTSTLTARFVDVFKLSASANQTGYVALMCGSADTVELALAQLKFFDPSNPGTLITGSGATGTYNRRFRVKCSNTYVIRNNYKVPVDIRLYKYRVISDTNQTPYTAFTAGLTDVGNPASTSIAVYPTDSTQLSDLFKLEGTTIKRLEPGEELHATMATPWFDYDPADYDLHGLSYQRQYHCQAYLLRISGPPAHDKTTITQLGTIGTAVDFLEKITVNVQYNSGGPDLNTVYVADASDSMTAGAVVSQQTVSNQEYGAV